MERRGPSHGERRSAGQELGSDQEADRDRCEEDHRGHGALLDRDNIHTKSANAAR
jgi:hypothetical protein